MAAPKILKYNGKASDGKTDLNVPKILNDIARTFDDQRFTIKVERIRKIRSLLFNSWYWSDLMEHAVNGCIESDPIQYAGITKAEIHLFFKRRFLQNGKHYIDENTGEMSYLRDPTTTTLTNTEMSDYCENVRKFLGEFWNTFPSEADAKDYYSTLEEPKAWKDLSPSQLKQL